MSVKLFNDGWTVLSHWPKFRPLAKRLGVPMDEKLHADGGEVVHRDCRGVEFTLKLDERVEVKAWNDCGPMRMGVVTERFRGFDVYHWPEFKAFALSFGFPYEAFVKWCSFRIAEGEQPTMTVNMAGFEAEHVDQERKAIDTTTMQNKEFRTFAPSEYKYEKML